MMLSNKNIQTVSRKFQIIFALVAVLVLSLSFGCQKSDPGIVSSELTNDAQLIKAIQEATNKQNIDAEELPSASKVVLEQDYSDFITVNAIIAPQLGYEISMGGTGARIGERSEVYFDLNGRKLRSEREGRDRIGRDREKCFDLVYPVTFIMPDGSTITADNEDGLAAIKSWYEANPGSKERPALQYPVEIIFKGRTITINNDEEMRRIYAASSGDRDGRNRDRKPSFEFVYPITYIMPDGSTITGNNEEEVKLAMRSWYAENPASNERPALQYPVEIIFKGRTLTINNDEEMRRIYAASSGDRDGRR